MKYLTKNKVWDIVEDYNVDKILYLLADRPNIHLNSFIVWLDNKDNDHRNYDLPSTIWFSGHTIWFKNGKKHRLNNKPALINENGTKEYYTKNKFIKSE